MGKISARNKKAASEVRAAAKKYGEKPKKMAALRKGKKRDAQKASNMARVKKVPQPKCSSVICPPQGGFSRVGIVPTSHGSAQKLLKKHVIRKMAERKRKELGKAPKNKRSMMH